MPLGQEWFASYEGSVAFIGQIDGTLGDVHKLLSLLFQKIGMGGFLPEHIFSNYPALTPITFVQDMSKLLISGTIQSLLFWLCSVVFLRATERGNLWGVFLSSGWYTVNRFLLMGLTLLIGCFCGNGLMTMLAYSMRELSDWNQFLISLGVFLVLYLAFSLIFCLRAAWSDKLNRSLIHFGQQYYVPHAFSFGKSLRKTLLCNIMPEMLVNYVRNAIIVTVCNCILEYRIHLYSLLAVFFLWGWSLVEDGITGLLSRLVQTPLPYFGQKCPISGIFWLPATLSILAFIAVGAAYTLSGAGESHVILKPSGMESFSSEVYMFYIPFAQEWWAGLSSWDLLQADFIGRFGGIVHLFLLSTLMAFLQYISSSYFATLFTQVIGRIFFIMGLMLVVFTLLNMIGTLLAEVLIATIVYEYIAGFIAVFVFVLAFCLQPAVMMQGLLTTVGFLALTSLIPSASMNGAHVDMFTQVLLGYIILIVANLLFSLVQNVVAVVEKKARKAVTVATGGLVR